MLNGCNVTFPQRKCDGVQLRAITDGDNTGGCCGGMQPDSMIVAVSAG